MDGWSERVSQVAIRGHEAAGRRQPPTASWRPVQPLSVQTIFCRAAFTGRACVSVHKLGMIFPDYGPRGGARVLLQYNKNPQKR